MKAGTLIDVEGYGPATVVYHNLDGYGVVPGVVTVDENNLPEPEAMLRDPYPSATKPCIGRIYTVRQSALAPATDVSVMEEARAALEAITQIKWGYDGDCGAIAIAEEALAKLDAIGGA